VTQDVAKTWRRTVLGVLLGIVAVGAIVVLAVRLGERIRRANRSAPTLDSIAYSAPDAPSCPQATSPQSGDKGVRAGGPRGVVVDERGVPVARALVAVVSQVGRSQPARALSADGRLARTNEEGRFELGEIEPGALGEHVLTVRHPSYLPATVEFGGDGDAHPYRIVLGRGRSIQGVVVTEDGTPAAGVRVSALGLNATHADGRDDRVPAATTRSQAAVSDARGGFTVSGLEDGWYLLDVVAPGLIVGPDRIKRFGGRLVLPGSGTVYARAGQEDVGITVLSVGIVSVKVVDDATGWPILGAHVDFRRDPSFEFVNQGVTATASPIVANGTPVHAGADAPGQSVFGMVLALRTYPVPGDAVCKVKVRAPGYQQVSAEIPIRPVGRQASQPAEVRLASTSKASSGALRLMLEDRRGTRITRTRAPLGFARHGDGPPRIAHHIWFDDEGVSEAFALSPGEYTIRAAGKQDSPLRPVVVTIASGKTAESRMVLDQWGGVELDVRNERGKPLMDYGIRAGPGRVEDGETIQVARGYEIRGVPIQIPGLGGGIRQLYRLGAGPWAVRVVHHGYAPAESLVECEAGVLQKLEIVLRPTMGDWR